MTFLHVMCCTLDSGFQNGPMARCAKDVALFLDGMRGTEGWRELGFHHPGAAAGGYLRYLTDGPKQLPRKVLWMGSLGDLMEVDSEVMRVCWEAIAWLKGQNVEVREGQLAGIGEMPQVFRILRSEIFEEKAQGETPIVLRDEYRGQPGRPMNTQHRRIFGMCWYCHCRSGEARGVVEHSRWPRDAPGGQKMGERQAPPFCHPTGPAVLP